MVRNKLTVCNDKNKMRCEYFFLFFFIKIPFFYDFVDGCEQLIASLFIINKPFRISMWQLKMRNPFHPFPMVIFFLIKNSHHPNIVVTLRKSKLSNNLLDFLFHNAILSCQDRKSFV